MMSGRREEDDWVTGVATVVPAIPSKCDRAYLVVVAGDGIGEMHLVSDGEAIIGRTSRMGIALRDDGISREHARVKRAGDTLTIEDLGSRNGTFVNGERIHGVTSLHDGDKVYVGHRTVLSLNYHDALDEAFQRQLREAAMYDALTRASSRRYFTGRLEAELQYAMRHHTPLALVLFDLDHLKKINDTHGHPAGDRLLIEVSAAVLARVRGEDLFGRLGGDEFGVICRGLTLEQAASFGERLRALVEELEIDVGAARPVRVTISTGVAAYPELRCVSTRELIDVADRALYVAKARGRNHVAVQSDETEETHVAAPQRTFSARLSE